MPAKVVVNAWASLNDTPALSMNKEPRGYRGKWVVHAIRRVDPGSTPSPLAIFGGFASE